MCIISYSRKNTSWKEVKQLDLNKSIAPLKKCMFDFAMQDVVPLVRRCIAHLLLIFVAYIE